MLVGLETPDLLADEAFGAWYAGSGAASSGEAGAGPSAAAAEAVQTNAMRQRPMKRLLAMTTSEFAGTRTTVGVA
jgi:hypothetical protein